MMHDYINRNVKCILDGCSILSGMLFQLNWNTVPTYLEQESILIVTRQELKKLTTRAYPKLAHRLVSIGRTSTNGQASRQTYSCRG